MRYIDKIAEWMRDKLSPQAQLRLGVVLFLASFPLYVYAPFSGEPPLIYLMSAAALTLTGVGIVIGAEALIEVTNDVEEVSGEVCASCGK